MTVRQPVSSIEKADIGLALLWLVRAGIAAALATPLVVAPDAYFPFVVGKAVYSRSVIEITFALWAALVIFYPRYRPRLSWVLIAFGAWFAASWLAGAFGVSYVRSLWSTYERMQGIVDLAHWLAFSAMAATAFGGLREWRALFTVNLIVGMVVCSLGLLSLYDMLQSESLGVGGGRLAATMGNPTYLAAYAAVNALIGIGLVVRSFAPKSADADGGESGAARGGGARRRRRTGVGRPRAAFDAEAYLRPVWTAAAAISLWALWETASRGAVAGLGVAFVFLTVFYAVRGARTARARKAAFGMLAALAAVVLLFVAARTTSALDPIMQSSRMLARLSIVGDAADRSLRGRVTAIGAGVTAFPERPLLGWGPDNFLSAWGRHFDYEETGIETRFDRAHSKIVEEMTTKGAAGLAAYMSVWAAMAWALIRSYRRRRGGDRAFIAIIGAAMIAYFTQNLFLFDNPSSTLQFGLLAAFAASEEMRARTRGGETGGNRARARDGETGGKESRARRLSVAANRLRSGLGSALVGAALAAGVAALMLALVFAVNMRIYAASVAVRQAENQTLWEARARYYQDAIETFPGLANYPRKLLAFDLSNRLADMRDAEFAYAVEIVTAAGADGAADNPTDWVLEAGLASFFQRAATRDSTLLETAAARVDRALTLAPRAKEPLGVQREQERLEKFFANFGGQ